MKNELELFRRWCKHCGHYPSIELVDRWTDLPAAVRTQLIREWAEEDGENVVHIEFDVKSV